MYYLPLVAITLICYVSADFNRVQVPSVLSQIRGNGPAKSKNNIVPSDDETYLDKPDNRMLIPVPMEEIHAKKKLLKKHPRSTIQKIIARNKKNKKKMAKHLTTKPTMAPASDDLLEEFDDRDDELTTQAATKKKAKKWNNKIPKYHSQIQKMQNKISPKHKRTRRHSERDNTIIFQDFDEFEFVDRKKDYDVIKTNFKKYW